MTRQIIEDRRIRRTKGLLHRALASLLHEKSWSDIGVKEILARADVGRSTFYTHFRDKDALLASSLRDTLTAAAPAAPPPVSGTERVLWFSLPLLAHIAEIRRAGTGRMSGRSYAPLHAQLERALVELIREELRGIPRPSASAAAAPSADLLARHIASTFLLVLEWWIGLPEPISAHDADAMFRAMVEPIVRAFVAP